jgi:hypothetical protein
MVYHNDTKKLIKILDMYNDMNASIQLLNEPFFNELYKKWKNIINKINITSLNIEKINSFSENHVEENKFTSKEIIDDIKKNLIHGYRIVYENNEIIYFTNKKTISKYVYHICKIIKSLKILFNRENIPQKLTFFESSKKKTFPKNKNKILGPTECNSGVTFTTFSQHKNGEITLYRKEEILKVLIHELIHANLIDSNIFLSKNSEKINDYFCVKYNILLNETYTETMATIMNILYIGIIHKMKKLEINKLFQNEVKYSIYICSKIMKYYNFKDFNVFKKRENECNSFFPQATNVVAYYLFKPILLLNYKIYGSLLKKYSHHYKIKTELFNEELIKLIIKKIDSFDLFEIKNDKNNSLRMTLYELKI